MCYYLTVAVPARHIARIDEVFGRGFQTIATANTTVMAAMPEQFEARLITSGMCSCDFYLGSHASAATDPTAHLRRKYENLGWKEAKIARALAQSVTSAAKVSGPRSGVRGDVTERLGAMCRVAGSMALLVHWYNGNVETERFTLGKSLRCRCDELPVQAQLLVENHILIAASPTV